MEFTKPKVKCIEVTEQQELVLELVGKNIRLNYLELIEIENLLEQLKLYDRRNF